jgi:hypothetical protein
MLMAPLCHGRTQWRSAWLLRQRLQLRLMMLTCGLTQHLQQHSSSRPVWRSAHQAAYVMLPPMVLRRWCLQTVLQQQLTSCSYSPHRQTLQQLWRSRLPSQQQHHLRRLLRSSRSVSSPCNQACLLFHLTRQLLQRQPLMLLQGKQQPVGRMMGPHASGGAWALARALPA